MNVHDSEKLAGLLELEGYVRAEAAARADVILLNTCSIREKAAEKVFGELGRLRRLKLQADPLCESCKPEGRVRLAREVDHVIRITERPDLRLDWGNLKSLCSRCHAAKSAAERAADRRKAVT